MSEIKVYKSAINTGVKVLGKRIETEKIKVSVLEEDVNFYKDKADINDLCAAHLLVAKNELMLRKAMIKQLETCIKSLTTTI